jgi:cohesin complex subunit SA-1/2
MAKRGEPDEDTTADFAAVEDDLCTSVIKTIMFYFMWKIIALRDSLKSNDVRHLTQEFFTNLELHKTSFSEALERIIVKRTPLDPVRLLAVSSVLDLYTLFSTLRHATPEKGAGLSDEVLAGISAMITTIPHSLHLAIMQTHDRLEKSFARKSRRKLEEVSKEEPGEDDAPIDSDDEDLNDEDEDNDDHEAGGGKEAKKQAVLVAEQRLCDVTGKIVLAVIGRVTEAHAEKVKERLMRNKLRLGSNYKEVVGYLEEKKPAGKRKGVAKSKKAAGVEKPPTGKGTEKSAAMVLEDDDIEDDEMDRPLERRDEDDEEALQERGLVEDEEPEPVEGDGMPEVEGEGECHQ